MNRDTLTPVQGVPVPRESPLAEITKKLEEKLSDHALEIREHKIRLDNGVGTFSQIREEIRTGDRDILERVTVVLGELKTDIAALRPKPPNWMPILALTFTVAMGILGGVSWLQERLGRSVTKEELRDTVSVLRDEIRALKDHP